MSLVPAVEALFAEQRGSWPRLRQGLEGLAVAKTRALSSDGVSILVRHIPHRVASTTAAVDPASIARRPCFLCPQNLDPEEKGLAFGSFLLYANPFPIVERHLTVVHREHRPQLLEGQAGALLDLAEALPGFVALYNGPRCGASAPDHLHLQAGHRDGLPALAAAARAAGPLLDGYPARAFVLKGAERARLLSGFDRTLAALAAAARQEPEPWVNVAAWWEAGEWTVLLFARGKHRPEAFHAGTRMVSPASVDLCGLLVTPRASDFDALAGAEAAAILREVSLDEERFRATVERLGTGA